MEKQHPSFENLSAFIDISNEKDEINTLNSHIATCSQCRNIVERLNKMKTEINEVLASSPVTSIAERNPSCLTPTAVSGYLAGSLNEQEMGIVENHLSRCDACLEEVMEARFVLQRMNQPNMVSVPADVSNKAKIFVSSEYEGEEIPKAFFRFIGNTLELINTIATDLSSIAVSEVQMPMPAYRAPDGQESKKTYNINLKQGDIAISCHIRSMEEGKLAMIVHAKQNEILLSSRRVSLYSDKQVILSEKSDKNGEVEFLPIAPGDYTIVLPGLDAKLAVNIKDEQGT